MMRSTTLLVLVALSWRVGFQQILSGVGPAKDNRITAQNTTLGRSRGTRRSDAAQSPLLVSERKVYLQSGRAYCLPCSVIRPGDVVTVIFWFRGESEDATLRDLILRHVYPDDGQSFAVDDRYKISPSHGLIIDPVYLNDTDRYWCKTVRESSSQFVEDYLDATVLGNIFPRESEASASNVSSFQRHEVDNTIECPILAKAPAQDEVTLYWSVYNETRRDLNIVSAKFSDGERHTFPKYGEVGNNRLAVEEFTKREERYCCHLFEVSSELRTGCVDMTWVAQANQQYPNISGCDMNRNTCASTLTFQQDCVAYECSVKSVYPKPALDWTFANCVDEGKPMFVQTASSTPLSADQTYDMISRLYIVEPQFEGACEFTCTANGDAVRDGTSKLTLAITRGSDNAATTSSSTLPLPIYTHCDCKWALVVFLAMLTTFLICLLTTWAILVFPRNRKFIQKHINELATFSCLQKHEEKAATGQDTDIENGKNAQLDSGFLTSDENLSENQQEMSPMLGDANVETGLKDATDEGSLCLVVREALDVLFTDSKNKWRPMGQFVTQSALHDDNGSGFQAIKDVMRGQDGGLFVIDARGLHWYDSNYTHHFTDLNQILDEESYCSVACYNASKLLLGLNRGKIVEFDVLTGQICNFCSVTPVGHAYVQLAGMCVDSLGFLFVGDRNGKAVSLFDESGRCITRMENIIEPVFSYAHACQEAQGLFVSSGTAVKKYNIVKSNTNSKIVPQVRFTIDQGSLGVENFYSGYVTVQENKLFIVNHLEVGECLQVLEHDVGKGTKEHSFIVKVPDLRGVRFLERDRMVVYTDDAIHLFERGDSSE
ncbi:uncharacterized protein LOC110987703 isoform X2 [Acanthaster planci]|nr:uncharacterized protein LOC110987703 isoform X2 [Acanthaster planci]XP_022106377.1 uncharacterized protein LOC110987703 isoform X2 [Acanthaster planci]XP_022106378.1 uncharacterized protein LOC110987703 isoform X2 [Acanthaster planci]XP_022106379.1 uncharacterized protein LOC110987703 isoform X2 [Acanthaster planci]